eukprot:423767_1
MTHSVQDETFLPYTLKYNVPVTRTDNNKTITNDSKYNFTAYGSNVIEFSSYFNNIYVWSLQINKFSINSMVFIGIDETPAKNLSKPYALQNNTTNYAYVEHKGSDTCCIYSCNKKIANKVKPFAVGDIITMTLNTAKHTLQYELNNAFIYQISNIDTSKEYRLAIYVQKSSVTIDDFRIMQTTQNNENKKSEIEEKEFEKYNFEKHKKTQANKFTDSTNRTHDSNTLNKWQHKYINLQTEIHRLKMQRRQTKMEHLNKCKSLNSKLKELKSTLTEEQTKTFVLERNVATLQDQLNAAKQLTGTHYLQHNENNLEKQLQQKQRMLDKKIQDERQLNQKMRTNKYIFYGIILVLLSIIIGLYYHQTRTNQQLMLLNDQLLNNDNICDNYMTEIQQFNDDINDLNSKHEILDTKYKQLQNDNNEIKEINRQRVDELNT